MCPSGWTYWSRRQGTDAVNTSPTTGGSYSGPGLYCRASNQAIGRKHTYHIPLLLRKHLLDLIYDADYKAATRRTLANLRCRRQTNTINNADAGAGADAEAKADADAEAKADADAKENANTDAKTPDEYNQ
jgi:hypothetical protein